MRTTGLAPWQHSWVFQTSNALGERDTHWAVHEEIAHATLKINRCAEHPGPA